MLRLIIANDKVELIVLVDVDNIVVGGLKEARNYFYATLVQDLTLGTSRGILVLVVPLEEMQWKKLRRMRSFNTRLSSPRLVVVKQRRGF